MRIKMAYFMDLISDEERRAVDRFYIPITSAVKQLKERFQFKNIYTAVCLNLGATPEQAEKGDAPCPYTGELKNMKGLIRSWIEERSPHSRQHYFRGGKRVYWKPDQRPLLFVNQRLGEQNSMCNWAPYMRVRGDGWMYDPVAAESWEKPADYILEAAEKKYRKHGMQGQGRTTSDADITLTKRKLNTEKVARLVVVAAAALTINALKAH